jgi:hypothetical protein
MRESFRSSLVLLILVAALAAAPAQGQEYGNVIRFGGAWYATVGDANDLSDNGFGAWVSYELRLSERLGVDFMAAYVDYDSIFDFLGGISMTPLTAALNVHLTPGKSVDVYAAPILGYAWLDMDRDVLGLGLLTSDSSDSGFVWGLGGGIDVPLGKGKWVFTGSLEYLSVDVSGGSFDNVVTYLGAGYRF